jgi:hypothetical protein
VASIRRTTAFGPGGAFQVRRASFAAFLLLPTLVFSQGPTVVDFDSLPVGVAVTTQFGGVGVVFDCVATATAPCNAAGPVAAALPALPSCGTSAGLALLLDVAAPHSLSLRATFVDPTTQLPAWTRSIAFTCRDADVGSLLFTVVVREPLGGILRTDTFVTPPGGCVVYAYDAWSPLIATVEVSTDADGCYLDDFAFEPPVGAVASSISVGCGPGPSILTATPPVLGSTVSFSGSLFVPFAAGGIAASFGTPKTAILAGGCAIFVDMNAFFELLPFAVDGTGSFSAAAVVPSAPSWAGVTIILQAYAANPFYGTAEISNAIVATFGY